MSIICCKVCGAITNSHNGYCPDCRQHEQEMLEKVREYIKTHPGVDLERLMRGTGAGEALISQFIEAGLLDGLDHALQKPCRTCGATITSGKVCQTCMRAIHKQVSDLRTQIKNSQQQTKIVDDGLHVRKNRRDRRG